MKRTELKRGSPLSRSSSKGPKRKGTRKPSMAGFWAAVTDSGTKRCALIDDGGGYRCAFTIDAHHYIPKQRLSDEAAVDPRNGVALCRFHHCDVEQKLIVCPRPPLLDDFLADHGLLPSGRPDPKREAA